MFRRRRRLHPIQHLRELLWPRRGWRRSTFYIAHRIGRLPGTPYSIAAGFASGAAISMTPFLGFHFLGAAALAWLVRGNILASALGTVVGNPWTFPFIFLWIYKLGNWMMGAAEAGPPPEALTLTGIFDHPGRLLLPMSLGSLPTAVAAWFAAFWPARVAVASYRRARFHRRMKRSHRSQAAGEIEA